MKVLALDTSAIVATVAVMEDEKLIAEIVLNHRKTHSEKILPMIEEILAKSELSLNDLDVFGTAVGPGSFTGLRIGVSTIKALAQTMGKRVVGVNTLDGLAYNIPYFPGKVCPIMDARREQVYTAVYQWNNGELSRESDYMAIGIEEYIEKLREKDTKFLFLGDGVPVYEDLLSERLGSQLVIAPPSCSMQKASSIALLTIKKASKGQTMDYMSLEPFYLRKSQAEREYEKKCRLEMGE